MFPILFKELILDALLLGPKKSKDKEPLWGQKPQPSGSKNKKPHASGSHHNKQPQPSGSQHKQPPQPSGSQHKQQKKHC
jgi:hypothetical protein